MTAVYITEIASIGIGIIAWICLFISWLEDERIYREITNFLENKLQEVMEAK